ncbi:T9SS type B sorting domain-containing protein [Winogradskyella forsetii]|uniref:T9SS type B sorting domain-containing protein n=1 Tax=Winogradskyella forsetii TaxID=2686077 RepID=UPI0015BB7E21|nr:T9SS type B sorting domain-containing protein [Winogradskyella forsetii]
MRQLLTLLILFVFSNLLLGQADTPLTLRTQFNGKYGYTIVGNTLNEFNNRQNPAPPCQMLTQSSATLTLSPDQNIVAAYLYWGGIGDGTTNPIVKLNGINYQASETWVGNSVDVVELSYFNSFTDVTTQVQTTANGDYLFSDLDLNSIITPYCGSRIYNGGWHIVVIYEQMTLPNVQLNIYDGIFMINAFFSIGIDPIIIDNLNVIDTQNAELTYVTLNGYPTTPFEDSVFFNGNILSNDLNPANDSFNSTNGFTGSTSNWNQDIDTFDISSFIAVGDTEASFSVNANWLHFMQTLVTSIQSELPDATAQLIQVSGQEICNDRNLLVDYTIQNVNSNAMLPANVPVSFYANNTLIQTVNTLTPIAIDGVLNLQTTLDIPISIPDVFTLTVIVDNNGPDTSNFSESNENNNEDSLTITLQNDSDIIPIFTIPNTYCENSSVPNLPVISDNNISGNWSPNNIDNQSNGIYVFTPDSDQCALPLTLEVTVLPNNSPIFSFQTTFCEGESVPNLPSTSDNGISGSWSSVSINNQVSDTYFFTPDSGDCALPVSVDITILPNINPSFSIPISICQGETPPSLPLVSDNGISGSWSPNSINNQSNGTYVFTPDSDQCALLLTLQLTVLANDLPMFSFQTTFCEGESVPNLPSTSDNGISGSWSSVSINNQVSDTYFFTPDAGDCALPVSVDITILPNIDPSFSIPISICQGETPPSLPLVSDNGISGSWSPNSINNQSNGTYVFTPDSDQCALLLILQLTVLANDIPMFSFQTTFCEGEPVPNLPSTSNNGISGSWSPSNINNQTSASYTFTPSSSECSAPLTLNIEIQPKITSAIDLYICKSENGSIYLPTTLNTDLITNDFSFEWFLDNQPLPNTLSELAVINPGEYTAIATPYTEGCTQEFNFSVTVLEPLSITYEVGEDFNANQSLMIETTGGSGSYVYSFNGLPFQNSPEYVSLNANEVLVKIKDSNACYEISELISLWQYPKFFTPNDDGKNDFWGIETQQPITIEIFNRYGKLITKLKNTEQWDGTLNSRKLPTSDYWFIVYYEENKVFKSHFTLKN